MPSDKASAEVAKGLRAVCDIMTQKVQLSYKRDIETKAFKKREQDYNNKVSGAKQFPAVRELYAKYNKHHKDIVEPIDKKLADLATAYQSETESFAESLVKALPINEIKTRQVLENAKAEFSRESESSQPAQGDRLQKLEELVNALKEKHDAQDVELAKLKKLNDKLRAGESSAPTLEKEREQLRSENRLLKIQLDALAERLGSVETWKAEFPKQVDSQWAEHTKFVEQAKAEWSATAAQINSKAVHDDTTREQIAALAQKDDALGTEITALRKYVEGHEDLLANVDIESLDDTIAKVQEYPAYSVLNDRVTRQQANVDSLKDSLDTTKQDSEKELAQRLEGFSNKIDYCGKKFDGLESRIKDLEEADSSADVLSSTRVYPGQAGTSNPGPASASGPELALGLAGISSRLDAAESRLTLEASRVDATILSVDTLQTKTDALQTEAKSIRGQIDNRCAALEMMVESLDDQWKNLNTTQMAQYMLEHLSRLQPSQLTPELRQLHMRLADLEKSVRDEKQERQARRERIIASYGDMPEEPGKRRVFAEEEAFHRQKRARVEGTNNVNGVANGHAHQ
ncbi:hypothetical protein VMCG_04431 [Cytospora schulzeri]|uniref:Uncharacterized protein n=1 Tax=Cytospora schulzeri TaxID=448051 RepID=A0A423WSQ8_9PEZI|nr:hypothetical protein VMCG_04431 [Valsa malicola]